MRYFECKAVIVSVVDQDLGNNGSFKFVPAMIDLQKITFIRQSTDEAGDLEPFTVVGTDSGQNLCVDVPFAQFAKLWKSYKVTFALN